MTARAKRRRWGPQLGMPCRRTAKEKGKATRRRALEEMPAEGRDSTRGRRVKRVRTVRPSRKRKKRDVGEVNVVKRM